jgi:uncharacterized protein
VIYLDTSVVVPVFVRETESPRVLAWRNSLVTSQLSELAVSTWTVCEFTSAMGIKVRNRDITATQGEAARALLESVLLPKITIVEATPTDFRLAEIMLREFSIGLRAGDALHVAIASRCEVREFVSLDKKLCKVAEALGLPVTRI